MIVFILAACNGKENNQQNEQRVLRIATNMVSSTTDTQWFRQQYTELYQFSHQNVEIEVVPFVDYSQMRYQTEPAEMPDEAESLKQLLTGPNPPDVVVFDLTLLRSSVEENLLMQLDPLIAEDKFDTSDIVPAVLEGIRNAGDGVLYGLAPSFTSSALFYNKKFFDDSNVPRDGMTWDEVFDLARLVSSGEGNDRKYGFSFNRWSGDPFYDMRVYTETLGLRMIDENGEKMTVGNSAQWEKVFSTIAKLNADKIVPQPIDWSQPRDDWGPFADDRFLSGDLAMVIAEYGYINQLLDANRNAEKIKGFEPIDWDVVTVPVHPEAREYGTSIYLSGVMAINAKAQNPDDAWDYIKFMNSEELAKLKGYNSYDLVSRKSYIKPKEGLNYNVAAFYQLLPAPPVDEYKVINKYNLWPVQQMGSELLQEVIKGNKTSKEALTEWQTRGDQQIKELKANAGTGDGAVVPLPRAVY
jgi:multiple sugar transport system substrate-binding protein